MKHTILIIEDSLTYQQGLKRAFLQAGDDVFCAGSGEEGLELALKTRPSLIILDIGLPDMDGREVCRRLKMNLKTRLFPILMLTMQEEDRALVESFEVGADAFMTKQESMETILKRVSGLIDLSEALEMKWPEIEEDEEKKEDILRGKIILLIDSDEAYLQGLKRELALKGYAVKTAISGVEGAHQIKESMPDLILLDLMTTGNDAVDGPDVCRQVRKVLTLNHLPIIMLTMSSAQKDIIRSFEAGCNDYIIKTLEFKFISIRIEAILRRQHFEKETKRIYEMLTAAEMQTKVVEAEKEAAEAKVKAAQELAQIKDEFISTVSHELRTPLTIVSMALNNLKRYEDQLPPETSKLIYTMDSNAKRLGRLINDILDLSRLESGKTEILCSSIDVGQLILNTVEEQQEVSTGRIPEIECQISPHLESAWANSDMIIRVLTNLIDNALRFAKEKITIEAKNSDSQIYVGVKNDGPDLSPEDQEKLFDKFIQLRRPKGGGGYKGTGIGLVICKNIIEQHHGHIGVKSEPGRGVEFHFTLPQRQIFMTPAIDPVRNP